MGETAMKNISFPRYAEYNCAFRYIVEEALGARYVMPPALTRRTMELGAKYSPDFVCTPFKTILGSMIEALEAGADTLLMTHGLCRLGYYGELLEQILRDLGVKSMRLLTNNPDKVYQLSEFGIEIAKRIPIQMEATKHDIRYLKTKQERMGHILNF